MIVEVISPATAARDRVLKKNLYERHGVGELWLLDPERWMLTIYRRRSGAAEFDPPAEMRTAGKARLELLGLEIDLDRLFVD